MNNDTPSVQHFRETVAEIEKQVGSVIVGQQDVVRLVLVGILAGGHVLLEGVPGLGKTLLVRTLSDVLDLKFSRIQFTPDLMPADIVGTEILIDQDGQREFKFEPGPIFANLVLADEVNRATPKTQSALLEAMQEASVTVADQTYRLEQPFFVLATQNPLEMEGTYPLPEAQLDRFLFKINVDYPSIGELEEIFIRTTTGKAAAPKIAANSPAILGMRELVREVPVASHVNQYAARLVASTHPDNLEAPELVKTYVRYGSSPRGGQALLLGAKALALWDGRYNVAFDDLKYIAPAALRHRLILTYEAEAEDIEADQIILNCLESLAVTED